LGLPVNRPVLVGWVEPVKGSLERKGVVVDVVNARVGSVVVSSFNYGHSGGRVLGEPIGNLNDKNNVGSCKQRR
jgi:hypothetical protein